MEEGLALVNGITGFSIDSGAIPNGWVKPWKGRGEGWAEIIQQVAWCDPARVREIKRDCTYSEIAESYKSKMADSYGVGYKYKSD